MTTDNSAANAVIYLRVSTKEQAERGGSAEGFSIPAQREACRRKAEELGIAVAEEFVDRGESARSANRPELQRMLEHLKMNPTSHVIVHKLDRLARNRLDDAEINVAIKASGAVLVSCTENIDETPSGILVHGIMSTIAEFYSANLATEVKKGSLQKAQSGGTVGRAPTGYKNVRATDSNGREIRTVAVDPERGPIMAWVFERYAKGDINVRDLLEEATERGLNSNPGPKTPSKPLSLSNFCRLLRHPYYKGIVRYKGVHYPGNHEPLVTETVWDRVQQILDERGRAGEKQRKHHHYLKGTVFCGDCGERLIVSHNRGRRGTLYPYFICIGRQKQANGCQQKAVLIETVEAHLVDYYPNIQPTQALIDQMRDYILDELQRTKAEAEGQHASQSRRRASLEKQRDKLLQAYYADAIPLELMKADQKRIEAELKNLQDQITGSADDHELVVTNLEKALGFTTNIATAYRQASPEIRRQMNQALFKKVYVNQDGITGIELRELFELLLHPAVVDAAQWHTDILTTEEPPASSFDCLDQLFADLVDSERRQLVSVGARNEQTPTHSRRGLSNDHLVGVEGLEPPTLSV